MDIDIRKIGGSKPVAPSSGKASASVGVSAGAAAGLGVEDGSGVSVKLTDAASLLQSVQETMRQTPANDPVKVAALKDAIASGRYHVDAQRVAAKFMKLEPDL